MSSIDISVRLDPKTFRRFCTFEALVRRRRWYMPVLFGMILITFAVAGLLGWLKIPSEFTGVLMGMGIAFPAISFGLYKINVETQVRRRKLKTSPVVYRLKLDDDKVSVMDGETGGSKVPVRWEDLYAACLHKGDIYLYVNSERALIIPPGQADMSQDELWAYISERIGEGRYFRV